MYCVILYLLLSDSENVADRNIDNVVIPVAISIAALLLIIIAIAVACFVCLRWVTLVLRRRDKVLN